jgi:hypothetical protein
MEPIRLQLRAKYEEVQDAFLTYLLRFWYVSLIVFLCSTALLTAGFRQLTTDGDVQEAVSPSGSRAIEDRDTFDTHFPDFPSIQQFYILARGDSILTLDAFLEIQRFDQELKLKVNYNDKNWYSLCFQVVEGAPCFQPGHPLGFWELQPGTFNLGLMTSDQDVIDRINGGFSYANLPVDFSAMFANPEPEEYIIPGNTNRLTKAKGVYYPLQYTGDDDDEHTIKEYEQELEDFCDDFRDTSVYIKPYTLTQHSIQRAGTKVIGDNLGTLLIVGNIIMIFLFLILNVRFSPFNSHFNLAFQSLHIVLFSYQQGIGLAGWVEAPNTATGSAVATFYALLFSLTHYFYIVPVFDYNLGLEPVERVKQTYRVIGAPLLCCNLLHTLTFAMINTIGMERMRDVSGNAAIVYAFMTLNYMTVMPSLLYMEARRQHNKKKDCFGCCGCTETSMICCEGQVHYKAEDVQRLPVESFFKSTVWKYLQTWPVKIVVLVLVVVYLAISIAFISDLEFKYAVNNLFTDDMEVSKCFDVMMDHYEEYGNLAVLMTDDMDIKKESVQLEYIQFIADVRDCKGCSEDWTIEGGDFWWYELFQLWMSQGRCNLEGVGTVTLTRQGLIPEEYFVPCLQQYLSYDGLPLAVFIEWNDDHTDINAVFANVRFDLFKEEDVFDGMTDMRDLLDSNGPGDSLFWSPPLVTYEFSLHIEAIGQVHLIVIWGITLIFCTFFLPSLLQATIIGGFLIYSTIGALAAVPYNDVNFNPFAEFYVASFLAETADFYLYYFAYLNHASGKPKHQQRFTLSKIAFPTIAKLVLMIGGTIGISVAYKLQEHAGMFYTHIIVNSFMVLFFLPIICMYLYPSLANDKTKIERDAETGMALELKRGEIELEIQESSPL